MGKLTYYERWIVGAANLLLQKQILTPDEIARKLRGRSEVQRRGKDSPVRLMSVPGLTTISSATGPGRSS